MKQRIITAVIGIIIVLPIILYGSWPFILLTYLLATIALFEFVRMFKLDKPYLYVILCSLFLWLIISSKQQLIVETFHFTTMNIIILLMVVLLTIMVISKNKFTFDDASRLFLTTLFLAFTFQYMITIRFQGLNSFLFILFIIWSTDTGAYFIGKNFGKRKLWPKISPNKTIGGAIGGILFAFIVATIFQMIYPFDKPFISIVIIALIISIFGQLGDLVASAIKRNYDVKDFGTLFPGHGGVLDRLDSFIFVLLILQMIHYF